MDYLTFTSVLIIVLPPYILAYVIIIYLGRRIDIIINSTPNKQYNRTHKYESRPVARHALIEDCLDVICNNVGVQRTMLDNPFARLFVDTEWFKK